PETKAGLPGANLDSSESWTCRQWRFLAYHHFGRIGDLFPVGHHQKPFRSLVWSKLEWWKPNANCLLDLPCRTSYYLRNVRLLTFSNHAYAVNADLETSRRLTAATT